MVYILYREIQNKRFEAKYNVVSLQKIKKNTEHTLEYSIYIYIYINMNGSMLCLHQDPEQHRVAESEPASRDRMGWRVDSDLPHKEAKQTSTGSREQLPPLRPQSYILLNSTAKVYAKGVTK